MYVTRKRAEIGGAANGQIADDLQRCLDQATPEVGWLTDGN